MAKEFSISLSVPDLASVLTALDLAINESRMLDNIVAFTEAKAVILNQIGAK